MHSNAASRKKHNPKSSPAARSSFRAEPWLNSLPSSKADFFRLIAVVSVAAAVAVACNFIATSIYQQPKPFCDNNDYSLSDYPLPRFGNMSAFFEPLFASDYCELCPENGLCYDGKLECGHGYRKHGKVCVEDGDINEMAKTISKWAEVRVCEAYAQFLCSGIAGSWVGEVELWNKLYEDKTRDKDKLDEAIYAPARKRANETIYKLLETRRNTQGIVEFKCPESIVDRYKSLSCHFRQWMAKHALLLVPACALFMGGILIASRAYRRNLLSARAEQIYHEVCDILEEKPSMSRNEDVGETPWVAASWLRDHLLSPKERKDMVLWKKVEELVQEDSRVDQYPKLVKGESKVVWEWQVEGSLSSSRKRIGESQPKLKEHVNSSSNVQTWTREVEPPS